MHFRSAPSVSERREAIPASTTVTRRGFAHRFPGRDRDRQLCSPPPVGVSLVPAETYGAEYLPVRAGHRGLPEHLLGKLVRQDAFVIRIHIQVVHSHNERLLLLMAGNHHIAHEYGDRQQRCSNEPEKMSSHPCTYSRTLLSFLRMSAHEPYCVPFATRSCYQ